MRPRWHWQMASELAESKLESYISPVTLLKLWDEIEQQEPVARDANQSKVNKKILNSTKTTFYKFFDKNGKGIKVC